jgi:hypothetical protein
MLNSISFRNAESFRSLVDRHFNRRILISDFSNFYFVINSRRCQLRFRRRGRLRAHQRVRPALLRLQLGLLKNQHFLFYMIFALKLTMSSVLKKRENKISTRELFSLVNNSYLQIFFRPNVVDDSLFYFRIYFFLIGIISLSGLNLEFKV